MPASRLAVLPLAALLGLMPLASASQALSPQPRPGLWMSESITLVDGKDVAEAVMLAQVEGLQKLPPEQRALVEQALRQRAQQKTRPECLTPDEVALITRPQALLARLEESMPGCRFQPVMAGGSRLSFTGQCTNPDGFSGDLQGQWTLSGDRATHMVLRGKGRVAGAETLGLKGGAQALHEFQTESRSTWQATDCGAVKPRTP